MFSEGQEFVTVYLHPLFRVSQDCNQGVSWAAFSSGEINGEEYISKFIQVAEIILKFLN